MIHRFPRVMYTALGDDQDWIVTEMEGERVILIADELDDDARRGALKAAYASLRKGWPAFLPLPLIAAGSWLGRKSKTRIGTAVMASALTASVAYALTLTPSEERPIAEPPAVVTLHSPATALPSEPGTPSPTATSARPASSPPATHRPARTRPAATRPATWPASRRDRSSAPVQPSRSATSPRDERPTPHPSPTSAPATAAVPTQAPAPEAALEPPAARTQPTGSSPDVAAGEEQDQPEIDDPTLLDAKTCSGIHVGAVLDPVLGLDLCLLG